MILENKPDKLHMCFKEVIGNIQKLNDLDQSPGFVYVKDTIRTSGNSYDIEKVIIIMMSNNVVRHKSCFFIHNISLNSKLVAKGTYNVHHLHTCFMP